jgi:type I restriction enzyme S subunit
MSAKLTDHFHLVAQAPGGVKRLRELILTLAVQGKLVPQDVSDEPVSELLKKIRVEKERLIAVGKIKRDKPLGEIGQVNFPFQVPLGWVWTRAISICILITDGDHLPPPKADSGVPFLVIGDVRNGIVNLQYATRFVPLEYFEKLDWGKKPHSGDILYTTVGSFGIPIPIRSQQNFCFQRHIALFRPAVLDVQDYLALLFQSALIYKQSESGATGIAQKTVPLSALRNLQIPLPPLAEQARIVTRVEELMRLCDALETQGQLEAAQHTQLLTTLLRTLTDSVNAEELATHWQRVATHFDLLLDRPEAIDALEQTILQLAVRGVLVPQDANDEPASVLLQKIRTEKDRLIAEGKLRRDRTSPLMAEPSLPFALPVQWEWVSIDDIASVGTGTTPSRDNLAFFTGGTIPWVTSGETSQNVIHSTEQHVTEAALSQTSLTVYPVGTLIMAMYGQGKTRGQISELGMPAATNQACAAIRLIDPSISHRRFVKLVFEMSYDQIRELSAGGAQPNLNVGKVKQSQIPLPPLAEQSRIVTRVEELRSLCSNLRQRLAARQTTQAHLAEALIAEAV